MISTSLPFSIYLRLFVKKFKISGAYWRIYGNYKIESQNLIMALLQVIDGVQQLNDVALDQLTSEVSDDPCHCDTWINLKPLEEAPSPPPYFEFLWRNDSVLDEFDWCPEAPFVSANSSEGMKRIPTNELEMFYGLCITFATIAITVVVLAIVWLVVVKVRKARYVLLF